MNRLAKIVLTVVSVFLPGLIHADQIAQFTQINSTATDFNIWNNGTNQSVSESSQVNFAYTLASGNPFGGANRAATLILNASTSTIATTGGGNYSETGFVGNFMITDNLTGNNLLSGNFGTAVALSGALNGTTANFGTTSGGFTVAFSSFYLDTSQLTNQSFTVTLNSLAAMLQGSGNYMATDHGVSMGFFDASLPNTLSPEPVTLSLTGGALLFFSWRLRRRAKGRKSPASPDIA